MLQLLRRLDGHGPWRGPAWLRASAGPCNACASWHKPSIFKQKTNVILASFATTQGASSFVIHSTNLTGRTGQAAV